MELDPRCILAIRITGCPKLDFIHLKISKKQSKLEQILDQEVAHAYSASGIYHDVGSLCEAVFETHLGTCEDPVDGCHSFSCRTNRHCGVAGDRVEW
jgi:hypothetical protein